MNRREKEIAQQVCKEEISIFEPRVAMKTIFQYFQRPRRYWSFAVISKTSCQICLDLKISCGRCLVS